MTVRNFPVTLGIIGTAKNTGKTTTLSFLMKGLLERGQPIGITGIGYDGEEIDNITNLPKPRLHLENGTLVATSAKCLNVSDAEYIVLADTDFHTALGRIKIVRITKPGLMVIAGPNTKNVLSEIIEILKSNIEAGYILVDGSLNRISPMYILDKLIFTTGASKSTDISKLTAEMALIEKVFGFNLSTDTRLSGMKVRVICTDSEDSLDTPSFVDEADLSLMMDSLNSNAAKVYIPGLIVPSFLLKNLEKLISKIVNPIELVLNSPIQLLLNDDPSQTSLLLTQLRDHKVSITYNYRPLLSAVTINPFYPNAESHRYKSSYINRNEFISVMSSALSTPVFNICESGADSIYDLL